MCRLQQIIECNNQLRTGLERGVKVEGGQGLMELWDFLQVSRWSAALKTMPLLVGNCQRSPRVEPPLWVITHEAEHVAGQLL